MQHIIQKVIYINVYLFLYLYVYAFKYYFILNIFTYFVFKYLIFLSKLVFVK